MIRAEEIDADGHFLLDGENVELEQILLGLQAQCHAFVSKDLHGFHPGAGGEVMVVALLGQEINKELQIVPRHVHPQVAQLHQIHSGLSLAPLEANGAHVSVENPGSHLPPLQPHGHSVLGPSGELGLGNSWGVRLLVKAAD